MQIQSHCHRFMFNISILIFQYSTKCHLICSTTQNCQLQPVNSWHNANVKVKANESLVTKGCKSLIWSRDNLTIFFWQHEFILSLVCLHWHIITVTRQWTCLKYPQKYSLPLKLLTTDGRIELCILLILISYYSRNKDQMRV